MEKIIQGQIIATSDNSKGLTILLDTTENGTPAQLQLTTTRHTDLQEIKRGDTIKISISNDTK